MYVDSKSTPISDNSKTRVESFWKHQAFYGPTHQAQSKELICQSTANGNRTDYLLRFLPGQAHVTLGTVGPLPLHTLTLSGVITKTEERSKIQTNLPLSPKSMESNVIWRDILVNLVNMSIMKPKGEPVQVTLEPRDVSPPSSPSRKAFEIIDNTATSAIDVAHDTGVAVARTGGAVVRAVAGASSRMIQSGRDVFTSASSSFFATLGGSSVRKEGSM